MSSNIISRTPRRWTRSISFDWIALEVCTHAPTYVQSHHRTMAPRLIVGIEVERALGVAPPETISIDPERPLYEACRRMLESRARRIPLVTNDSQTDRSHVLSVVTQYRILKFVAVNVNDTQKLRKPLQELLIGTYDNIATASMDTPVIDVIHILVERSISSVPILNSEGTTKRSSFQGQMLRESRRRLQCFRSG